MKIKPNQNSLLPKKLTDTSCRRLLLPKVLPALEGGPPGGGGGGIQQRFIRRGLPRGPNLLPFYIPFLTEKYRPPVEFLLLINVTPFTYLVKNFTSF